jgi:hypothetical protein
MENFGDSHGINQAAQLIRVSAPQDISSIHHNREDLQCVRRLESRASAIAMFFVVAKKANID